METDVFRFSSKEDLFLSEILERPVFKLCEDPHGVPLDHLTQRQSSTAFCFVRCSLGHTELIHHLQRSGFFLADIALSFSCEPNDGSTWASKNIPRANIRSAEPDDLQPVAAIAESAFRWSRFHQDPQIPAIQANLLKRRWVENFFCGQRGQSLIVAEEKGRIHGFLLILENEREHIIDLIAVAPEGQGRGIGKALVQQFLLKAKEAGKIARVGTQAANIPSVRLYEKAGFRLQKSEAIFHHHAL